MSSSVEQGQPRRMRLMDLFKRPCPAVERSFRTQKYSSYQSFFSSFSPLRERCIERICRETPDGHAYSRPMADASALVEFQETESFSTSFERAISVASSIELVGKREDIACLPVQLFLLVHLLYFCEMYHLEVGFFAGEIEYPHRWAVKQVYRNSNVRVPPFRSPPLSQDDSMNDVSRPNHPSLSQSISRNIRSLQEGFPYIREGMTTFQFFKFIDDLDILCPDEPYFIALEGLFISAQVRIIREDTVSELETSYEKKIFRLFPSMCWLGHLPFGVDEEPSIEYLEEKIENIPSFYVRHADSTNTEEEYSVRDENLKLSWGLGGVHTPTPFVRGRILNLQTRLRKSKQNHDIFTRSVLLRCHFVRDMQISEVDHQREFLFLSQMYLTETGNVQYISNALHILFTYPFMRRSIKEEIATKLLYEVDCEFYPFFQLYNMYYVLPKHSFDQKIARFVCSMIEHEDLKEVVLCTIVRHHDRNNVSDFLKSKIRLNLERFKTREYIKVGEIHEALICLRGASWKRDSWYNRINEFNISFHLHYLFENIDFSLGLRTETSPTDQCFRIVQLNRVLKNIRKPDFNNRSLLGLINLKLFRSAIHVSKIRKEEITETRPDRRFLSECAFPLMEVFYNNQFDAAEDLFENAFKKRVLLKKDLIELQMLKAYSKYRRELPFIEESKYCLQKLDVFVGHVEFSYGLLQFLHHWDPNIGPLFADIRMFLSIGNVMTSGIYLRNNRADWMRFRESQEPGNQVALQTDICAICHEELLQEEESESQHMGSVILSECNHPHHVSCLATWTTRTRNCPLCRAAVRGEVFPHAEHRIRNLATTSSFNEARIFDINLKEEEFDANFDGEYEDDIGSDEENNGDGYGDGDDDDDGDDDGDDDDDDDDDDEDDDGRD